MRGAVSHTFADLKLLLDSTRIQPCRDPVARGTSVALVLTDQFWRIISLVDNGAAVGLATRAARGVGGWLFGAPSGPRAGAAAGRGVLHRRRAREWRQPLCVLAQVDEVAGRLPWWRRRNWPFC